MSANAMSAAPSAGACRMRWTGRSFHLHLGIGAFAMAGALGQSHAASIDGAQAFEQSRAMRLVGDALAPSTSAQAAQLSMLMMAPVPDTLAADGVFMLPPSPVVSPQVRAVSAADRLRNDPVQTAPVAPKVAKAAVAVKPTGDERALARYIARSYRVAYESVERFVHHAYRAANEFRLDPHLILAVMAVESSFDPNAESPAGAQGLMQVLTRVHTSKFEPFGGAEAAYDPVANIKVGARILSEYVRRHGDVAAGLKAYVGAALLDSDGGYGSKVLKRQAEFDAVLRSPAPPVMQAGGHRQAAKAQAPGREATGPAASTPAAGGSTAGGSTAGDSDAAAGSTAASIDAAGAAPALSVGL